MSILPKVVWSAVGVTLEELWLLSEQVVYEDAPSEEELRAVIVVEAL